MLFQRVIALIIITISSLGCTGLQSANDTATHANTISKKYINYDITNPSAFSDMETIKKRLRNFGIATYTPDYLIGFTYLFVSQDAFLKSEIAPKRVKSISTNLEYSFGKEFVDLVLSFTDKELRNNPSRGTRFYDLTKLSPTNTHFAVIIYDELTLNRFKWPSKQTFEDAVSFSLLHEVGHALAGVDGSPVYNYLSHNIPTGEQRLKYYMEAYADTFATTFTYTDLSDIRANQLLTHMICFREKTLTRKTHDTIDLLISLKKKDSPRLSL
ncbi:hypothetical protein RJ45_22080 [Photobacterium gaetbulicola]|uniref:Uncharacterized protein n=1 Tax=Photobacterium gaetbulicola TaxID=1295392 RepID=A0A0B9GY79_9GAMM|nr:hypothetical protein [Photobacterium gaetbulicola]KHT61602.1 hypothetical protein RJ45_22080 [Photobacterium gaetbulicola]